MQRVPPGVLSGFGLDVARSDSFWGLRLSGGRGPAFRYADIVLKPVVDADEARAIAEAMHAVEVDPALVRVARPVAALDGDWVVDGWTAWERLDGIHAHGPHDLHGEAIAAIDELHRGLEVVLRAQSLDARAHRWAVADQVAWGEHAVELDPRLELLVELLRACSVLGGGSPSCPPQLVHGDLWANLLFHPEMAPGVIDFSPYWRSPSYAKAVYVFDAIAWGGADSSILELVADDPGVLTCLPQAAIFRIVALDGIRNERGADISPHLPAFEAMAHRVAELASRAGRPLELTSTTCADAPPDLSADPALAVSP